MTRLGRLQLPEVKRLDRAPSAARSSASQAHEPCERSTLTLQPGCSGAVASSAPASGFGYLARSIVVLVLQRQR
jgi:hypothetical protein